ncbi:MAG: pentapeptide repeat-containing protein [Flavobacteriales bacterium]
MSYFEDEVYKGIDFSDKTFEKAEYENCEFINCNFANVDLSKIQFTECKFTGCNLSSVNLHKTYFQKVQFFECKMLGLLFNECNTFGFSIDLESCTLNHSSFYNTNLQLSNIEHCSCIEVDFSESDLTQVNFNGSNLAGAIFDRTNLTKTDFRLALNYELILENNLVKKTKFSQDGLQGLVKHFDIEIY